MRVPGPSQEPLGPEPNDPVESVFVSVVDYSWYMLVRLAFEVDDVPEIHCHVTYMFEQASFGPTVRAKLLCVYLYVYTN